MQHFIPFFHASLWWGPWYSSSFRLPTKKPVQSSLNLKDSNAAITEEIGLPLASIAVNWEQLSLS